MNKLFSIIIPHKYDTGKTHRKIWFNAILSMCWQKRKVVHDNLTIAIDNLLKTIPPIPVTNDMKLRVSFGLWSGKSTGNLDIDGMAYIGKVAIDCLARKMAINDSIHTIVEVRYVYLGKQIDESVVMQVESV